MTILCQERCVRAVEILTARGAIFSYRWLCYVGCKGFSIKDIGETNMAVEAASAAEAHPALRFFDLLSWQKCQRGQRPDHKWGGFYSTRLLITVLERPSLNLRKAPSATSGALRPRMGHDRGP